MKYSFLIILIIASTLLFANATNAALPEEEICVITPVSGIFFERTQITIICGSRIVKSSYYWGTEKPKTFNKTAKTFYNADKFQALTVSYIYQGKDKKNKPRTYTWYFSSGHNTCEVTPKGGLVQTGQSTLIQVRCGKNVRNATYQWGNEKAISFKDKAGAIFEYDRKIPLLVRFQYPLSSKSSYLKNNMVTAEFVPKFCKDSDGGNEPEIMGTLSASGPKGEGILNSADKCIDSKKLKEFYCGVEGINSIDVNCEYGCSNGACNYPPGKKYSFDREPLCAPTCDNQSCQLTSEYFKNDTEAQSITNINQSIVLNNSKTSIGTLGWRVANALQMAGYSSQAMMYGRTVDKKFITELDCRLAKAELLINQKAAKLPEFLKVAGPDFKGNIPQKFAAYTYASIFDLFNTGGNYLSYTNQCLMAGLCYQMPEAIAAGCSDKTYSSFNQNKIIQSPALFGFSMGSGSGINFRFRPALAKDSLPDSYPDIELYQNILIHEFTHWLDSRHNFPRNYCTGQSQIFNKLESPFINISSYSSSDFVSGYAMTNPHEDAAESVTAYIMYPDYFRIRAATRPILKMKYDYLKNSVFGGYEFKNPNITKVELNKIAPSYIPNVTNSLSVGTDKFMIGDIRYSK